MPIQKWSYTDWFLLWIRVDWSGSTEYDQHSWVSGYFSTFLNHNIHFIFVLLHHQSETEFIWECIQCVHNCTIECVHNNNGECNIIVLYWCVPELSTVSMGCGLFILSLNLNILFKESDIRMEELQRWTFWQCGS